MQDDQIREAINAHCHAPTVGDFNAEHDIYDDKAICDYPRSGERILGRANLQAMRSHRPGKPSGFKARGMLGHWDLWITEYTITYQGRRAYIPARRKHSKAKRTALNEASLRTGRNSCR